MLLKSTRIVKLIFSILLLTSIFCPLWANAFASDKREMSVNIDSQIKTNDADKIINDDPLQRVNRAFFKFNDTFDHYFMKPVAKVYNAIVPKPLNRGINNFFNNLTEIGNVANDVLQFNFKQMANDAWRFTINSTFGLAGFMDIATRMSLPYRRNDFGLTLAKWGYQRSAFFVIPFLGPSNIRDSIGMLVDYFTFSVYPFIEPPSLRYQTLALLYVDRRANLLPLEPVFAEAAINKYVFQRNAYMQYRSFQIAQGQSKE